MDNGVLVFAHSDSDGLASAAVLRRAIPHAWIIAKGSGATLPLEKLRKNETVFLLDMTFPLEDMQHLCSNHQVICIDHHKSAIDKLLDAGLKFTGLWNDTESACALTWKYFYPEEEIPLSLKWISDFDTWTFEFEESLPFSFGLEQLILRPSPAGDLNWKRILEMDRPFIDGLLDRGRSIIQYTKALYQAYAKDLAYTTELCGKTFMVLNIRSAVSLAFEFCDLSQCDGVLLYRWANGPQLYQVSLYSSDRARSVTDMQEIAVKFEGGGHPGAAGFRCKELPFKQNVISGREINYDNPYSQAMEYLEQHPAVELFAANNTRITSFSAAFMTTFEGLSAVGVNTPETDNRCFNVLSTVNSQLGITYAWTGMGYRVIVRSLCYNADVSAIMTKYNGQLIKGAVWFYCTELPFKLEEYKK